MRTLLSSLPQHILRDTIEPYTRTIQTQELLDDIKHFQKTINHIHTLYSCSLMNMLDGDMMNGLCVVSLVRIAWCFIELDLLSYILSLDIITDFTNPRFRHIGQLAIVRLDFLARNTNKHFE